MTQIEKANAFKALHKTGNPLVLYNTWDAGGAKTLADAGADAVATGSWSMAAAHGFEDGESIPLDFVLQIVERITRTVDLPVSVDFEGGYAIAPAEVAANVEKIIDAGAIGINFEDRIVGGEGLHSLNVQADRIKAIRTMADGKGVPLFINARTDLFLGSDPATHSGSLSKAQERQAAYAEAGANGFFVPGLVDALHVETLTEDAPLPINVMMLEGLGSVQDMAQTGVSRISFGPSPYFEWTANLSDRFKALRQ